MKDNIIQVSKDYNINSTNIYALSTTYQQDQALEINMTKKQNKTLKPPEFYSFKRQKDTNCVGRITQIPSSGLVGTDGQMDGRINGGTN